ncbi:MACPF domain-containing protein [Psidium guajava]|nr:MACPF domain-containing protein [Psidium guajava]
MSLADRRGAALPAPRGLQEEPLCPRGDVSCRPPWSGSTSSSRPPRRASLPSRRCLLLTAV